jgi:hypothetical protein
MTDTTAGGQYKPAFLERLRKMWDETPLPVREISLQTKVPYGTLVILARECGWRKRSTARGNVTGHPKSTLPGWKFLLDGKPKPPKLTAAVWEVGDARTYDKDTLAAITRLQRSGFVVYQTKPGEFMVGTKRLDHAGMMAKAVRYGLQTAPC